MIKLQQKQVKIISILIAVVFVGSVVALALTQSGSLRRRRPPSALWTIVRSAVSTRSSQRQMQRCRRLRRRHRQILKRNLRI